MTTTRSVSIRGAGPGVILTGGSDGAVVGLSLAPQTRISVSNVTFRAAVDRTAPELWTTGPVDVTDVRFDTTKAYDDGNPNATTARMTVRGAGRVTSLTIDRPETATGPVLAAVGTEGDAAESPVIDGLTATNDARAGVVFLRDASASSLRATSTATPSTVVWLTRSRLERSEITTPKDNAAVGVEGSAPSEIFGSTIRGGFVRTFGSDVRSSHNALLPGGRTAISANSGNGDVFSTHDVIITTPPATPETPEAAISANTGAVHLVGSYVTDRISHDPDATCTAVGSIGIVGTGAFDCGLTGLPADPGFVDAAAGDFRLRPDSPLIDAGPPMTAQGLFDVLGLPRAVDGNADGVARADVGPNEFQPTPETILEPGARPTTPGAAATFAFRSTTAGTSFTCVLDGGAPQPCDGGTFVTGPLGEGVHTFTVAATLGAHTDPTPATETFEVRSVPPGGGDVPPGGGPPGAPGTPGAPGAPGTPGPGRAGSPGAGGTTRPAVVRLTGLRLLRAGFRAGRVPAKARLAARVSARATVRATLRRTTGRRTTRRVGRRVAVTVRRAGTVSVALRRFASRLPRGTYRVELAAGKTVVRSRTFVVRR